MEDTNLSCSLPMETVNVSSSNRSVMRRDKLYIAMVRQATILRAVVTMHRDILLFLSQKTVVSVYHLKKIAHVSK